MIPLSPKGSGVSNSQSHLSVADLNSSAQSQTNLLDKDDSFVGTSPKSFTFSQSREDEFFHRHYQTKSERSSGSTPTFKLEKNSTGSSQMQMVLKFPPPAKAPLEYEIDIPDAIYRELKAETDPNRQRLRLSQFAMNAARALAVLRDVNPNFSKAQITHDKKVLVDDKDQTASYETKDNPNKAAKTERPKAYNEVLHWVHQLGGELIVETSPPRVKAAKPEPAKPEEVVPQPKKDLKELELPDPLLVVAGSKVDEKEIQVDAKSTIKLPASPSPAACNREIDDLLTRDAKTREEIQKNNEEIRKLNQEIVAAWAQGSTETPDNKQTLVKKRGKLKLQKAVLATESQHHKEKADRALHDAKTLCKEFVQILDRQTIEDTKDNKGSVLNHSRSVDSIDSKSELLDEEPIAKYNTARANALDNLQVFSQNGTLADASFRQAYAAGVAAMKAYPAAVKARDAALQQAKQRQLGKQLDAIESRIPGELHGLGDPPDYKNLPGDRRLETLRNAYADAERVQGEYAIHSNPAENGFAKSRREVVERLTRLRTQVNAELSDEKDSKSPLNLDPSAEITAIEEQVGALARPHAQAEILAQTFQDRVAQLGPMAKGVCDELARGLGAQRIKDRKDLEPLDNWDEEIHGDNGSDEKEAHADAVRNLAELQEDIEAFNTGNDAAGIKAARNALQAIGDETDPNQFKVAYRLAAEGLPARKTEIEGRIPGVVEACRLVREQMAAGEKRRLLSQELAADIPAPGELRVQQWPNQDEKAVVQLANTTFVRPPSLESLDQKTFETNYNTHRNAVVDFNQRRSGLDQQLADQKIEIHAATKTVNQLGGQRTEVQKHADDAKKIHRERQHAMAEICRKFEAILKLPDLKAVNDSPAAGAIKVYDDAKQAALKLLQQTNENSPLAGNAFAEAYAAGCAAMHAYVAAQTAVKDQQKALKMDPQIHAALEKITRLDAKFPKKAEEIPFAFVVDSKHNDSDLEPVRTPRNKAVEEDKAVAQTRNKFQTQVEIARQKLQNLRNDVSTGQAGDPKQIEVALQALEKEVEQLKQLSNQAINQARTRDEKIAVLGEKSQTVARQLARDVEIQKFKNTMLDAIPPWIDENHGEKQNDNNLWVKYKAANQEIARLKQAIAAFDGLDDKQGAGAVAAALEKYGENGPSGERQFETLYNAKTGVAQRKQEIVDQIAKLRGKCLEITKGMNVAAAAAEQQRLEAQLVVPPAPDQKSNNPAFGADSKHGLPVKQSDLANEYQKYQTAEQAYALGYAKLNVPIGALTQGAVDTYKQDVVILGVKPAYSKTKYDKACDDLTEHIAKQTFTIEIYEDNSEIAWPEGIDDTPLQELLTRRKALNGEIANIKQAIASFETSRKKAVDAIKAAKDAKLIGPSGDAGAAFAAAYTEADAVGGGYQKIQEQLKILQESQTALTKEIAEAVATAQTEADTTAQEMAQIGQRIAKVGEHLNKYHTLGTQEVTWPPEKQAEMPNFSEAATFLEEANTASANYDQAVLKGRKNLERLGDSKAVHRESTLRELLTDLEQQFGTSDSDTPAIEQLKNAATQARIKASEAYSKLCQETNKIPNVESTVKRVDGDLSWWPEFPADDKDFPNASQQYAQLVTERAELNNSADEFDDKYIRPVQELSLQPQTFFASSQALFTSTASVRDEKDFQKFEFSKAYSAIADARKGKENAETAAKILSDRQENVFKEFNKLQTQSKKVMQLKRQRIIDKVNIAKKDIEERFEPIEKIYSERLKILKQKQAEAIGKVKSIKKDDKLLSSTAEGTEAYYKTEIDRVTALLKAVTSEKEVHLKLLEAAGDPESLNNIDKAKALNEKHKEVLTLVAEGASLSMHAATNARHFISNEWLQHAGALLTDVDSEKFWVGDEKSESGSKKTLRRDVGWSTPIAQVLKASVQTTTFKTKTTFGDLFHQFVKENYGIELPAADAKLDADAKTGEPFRALSEFPFNKHVAEKLPKIAKQVIKGQITVTDTKSNTKITINEVVKKFRIFRTTKDSELSQFGKRMKAAYDRSQKPEKDIEKITVEAAALKPATHKSLDKVSVSGVAPLAAVLPDAPITAQGGKAEELVRKLDSASDAEKAGKEYLTTIADNWPTLAAAVVYPERRAVLMSKANEVLRDSNIELSVRQDASHKIVNHLLADLDLSQNQVLVANTMATLFMLSAEKTKDSFALSPIFDHALQGHTTDKLQVTPSPLSQSAGKIGHRYDKDAATDLSTWLSSADAKAKSSLAHALLLAQRLRDPDFKIPARQPLLDIKIVDKKEALYASIEIAGEQMALSPQGHVFVDHKFNGDRDNDNKKLLEMARLIPDPRRLKQHATHVGYQDNHLQFLLLQEGEGLHLTRLTDAKEFAALRDAIGGGAQFRDAYARALLRPGAIEALSKEHQDEVLKFLETQALMLLGKRTTAKIEMTTSDGKKSEKEVPNAHFTQTQDLQDALFFLRLRYEAADRAGNLSVKSNALEQLNTLLDQQREVCNFDFKGAPVFVSAAHRVWCLAEKMSDSKNVNANDLVEYIFAQRQFLAFEQRDRSAASPTDLNLRDRALHKAMSLGNQKRWKKCALEILTKDEKALVDPSPKIELLRPLLLHITDGNEQAALKSATWKALGQGLFQAEANGKTYQINIISGRCFINGREPSKADEAILGSKEYRELFGNRQLEVELVSENPKPNNVIKSYVTKNGEKFVFRLLNDDKVQILRRDEKSYLEFVPSERAKSLLSKFPDVEVIRVRDGLECWKGAEGQLELTDSMGQNVLLKTDAKKTATVARAAGSAPLFQANSLDADVKAFLTADIVLAGDPSEITFLAKSDEKSDVTTPAKKREQPKPALLKLSIKDGKLRYDTRYQRVALGARSSVELEDKAVKKAEEVLQEAQEAQAGLDKKAGNDPLASQKETLANAKMRRIEAGLRQEIDKLSLNGKVLVFQGDTPSDRLVLLNHQNVVYRFGVNEQGKLVPKDRAAGIVLAQKLADAKQYATALSIITTHWSAGSLSEQELKLLKDLATHEEKDNSDTQKTQFKLFVAAKVRRHQAFGMTAPQLTVGDNKNLTALLNAAPKDNSALAKLEFGSVTQQREFLYACRIAKELTGDNIKIAVPPPIFSDAVDRVAGWWTARYKSMLEGLTLDTLDSLAVDSKSIWEDAKQPSDIKGLRKHLGVGTPKRDGDVVAAAFDALEKKIEIQKNDAKKQNDPIPPKVLKSFSPESKELADLISRCDKRGKELRGDRDLLRDQLFKLARNTDIATVEDEKNEDDKNARINEVVMHLLQGGSVPAGDDDKARKLEDMALRYLFLKTEYNHVDGLKKQLKDYQKLSETPENRQKRKDLEEDIGKRLAANRSYNLAALLDLSGNDPNIKVKRRLLLAKLFAEGVQGYRLRQEQSDILDRILDPDPSKKKLRLAQLPTGWGKTDVVFFVGALVKADGQQLVILTSPESLTAMNLRDVDARFVQQFLNRAEGIDFLLPTFKCDPNPTIVIFNKDTKTEESAPDKKVIEETIRKLREYGHQVEAWRSCLLQAATHGQLLGGSKLWQDRLKTALDEMLVFSAKAKDEGLKKAFRKCAIEINHSLNELENAFGITDEIDSVRDPLKEWNVPGGPKQLVTPVKSAMAAEIFGAAQKLNGNNFPLEEAGALKAMSEAQYHGSSKAALVDDLANQNPYENPESLAGSLIMLAGFCKASREDLIAYLKAKSLGGDVKEAANSVSNTHEKLLRFAENSDENRKIVGKLFAYRQAINSFFPNAISDRNQVKVTMGTHPGRHFHSVPYERMNEPSESGDHKDSWVTVFNTFQVISVQGIQHAPDKPKIKDHTELLIDFAVDQVFKDNDGLLRYAPNYDAKSDSKEIQGLAKFARLVKAAKDAEENFDPKLLKASLKSRLKTHAGDDLRNALRAINSQQDLQFITKYVILDRELDANPMIFNADAMSRVIGTEMGVSGTADLELLPLDFRIDRRVIAKKLLDELQDIKTAGVDHETSMDPIIDETFIRRASDSKNSRAIQVDVGSAKDDLSRANLYLGQVTKQLVNDFSKKPVDPAPQLFVDAGATLVGLTNVGVAQKFFGALKDAKHPKRVVFFDEQQKRLMMLIPAQADEAPSLQPFDKDIIKLQVEEGTLKKDDFFIVLDQARARGTDTKPVQLDNAHSYVTCSGAVSINDFKQAVGRLRMPETQSYTTVISSGYASELAKEAGVAPVKVQTSHVVFGAYATTFKGISQASYNTMMMELGNLKKAAARKVLLDDAKLTLEKQEMLASILYSNPEESDWVKTFGSVPTDFTSKEAWEKHLDEKLNNFKKELGDIFSGTKVTKPDEFDKLATVVVTIRKAEITSGFTASVSNLQAAAQSEAQAEGEAEAASEAQSQQQAQASAQSYQQVQAQAQAMAHDVRMPTPPVLRSKELTIHAEDTKIHAALRGGGLEDAKAGFVDAKQFARDEKGQVDGNHAWFVSSDDKVGGEQFFKELQGVQFSKNLRHNAEKDMKAEIWRHGHERERQREVPHVWVDKNGTVFAMTAAESSELETWVEKNPRAATQIDLFNPKSMPEDATATKAVAALRLRFDLADGEGAKKLVEAVAGGSQKQNVGESKEIIGGAWVGTDPNATFDVKGEANATHMTFSVGRTGSSPASTAVQLSRPIEDPDTALKDIKDLYDGSDAKTKFVAALDHAIGKEVEAQQGKAKVDQAKLEQNTKNLERVNGIQLGELLHVPSESKQREDATDRKIFEAAAAKLNPSAKESKPAAQSATAVTLPVIKEAGEARTALGAKPSGAIDQKKVEAICGTLFEAIGPSKQALEQLVTIMGDPKKEVDGKGNPYQGHVERLRKICLQSQLDQKLVGLLKTNKPKKFEYLARLLAGLDTNAIKKQFSYVEKSAYADNPQAYAVAYLVATITRADIQKFDPHGEKVHEQLFRIISEYTEQQNSKTTVINKFKSAIDDANKKYPNALDSQFVKGISSGNKPPLNEALQPEDLASLYDKAKFQIEVQELADQATALLDDEKLKDFVDPSSASQIAIKKHLNTSLDSKNISAARTALSSAWRGAKEAQEKFEVELQQFQINIKSAFKNLPGLEQDATAQSFLDAASIGEYNSKKISNAQELAVARTAATEMVKRLETRQKLLKDLNAVDNYTKVLQQIMADADSKQLGDVDKVVQDITDGISDSKNDLQELQAKLNNDLRPLIEAVAKTLIQREKELNLKANELSNAGVQQQSQISQEPLLKSFTQNQVLAKRKSTIAPQDPAKAFFVLVQAATAIAKQGQKLKEAIASRKGTLEREKQELVASAEKRLQDALQSSGETALWLSREMQQLAGQQHFSAVGNPRILIAQGAKDTKKVNPLKKEFSDAHQEEWHRVIQASVLENAPIAEWRQRRYLRAIEQVEDIRVEGLLIDSKKTKKIWTSKIEGEEWIGSERRAFQDRAKTSYSQQTFLPDEKELRLLLDADPKLDVLQPTVSRNALLHLREVSRESLSDMSRTQGRVNSEVSSIVDQLAKQNAAAIGTKAQPIDKPAKLVVVMQ
jgi:hypothetical protein